MSRGTKRVDREAKRIRKRGAEEQPPVNWPNEVRYLNVCCVASPLLPGPQSSVFCRQVPKESPYHPAKLRALAWTSIRRINDKTHPAAGQCGLFAKKDIPPRTFVVPYLGEVHTEEESDEASNYDLRVFGPSVFYSGDGGPYSQYGVPLGIDATRAGCEARFVNDYRGAADRPNVFFEEYEIPAPAGYSLEHSRRGLVFKTGSKPVKAGEELLVSYGKGFWATRRTQHCKHGRAEGCDAEAVATVTPPASYPDTASSVP